MLKKIKSSLINLLYSLKSFLNHLLDWESSLGESSYLTQILASAEPKADLMTRLEWLSSLLIWVRQPILPSGNKKGSSHIQSVRVKFLLQILEKNPEWRSKCSRVIHSLLLETDPVNFFCQTGLPRQHSFISELIDRLNRKWLPSPRQEKDLSELITRFFRDEKDADWIASMDKIILKELFLFISYNSEIQSDLRRHFRLALREAIIILSSQIESFGLSTPMRARSIQSSVSQSAFWKYRFIVNSLLNQIFDFESTEKEISPQTYFLQVEACKNELNQILSQLETQGVSVELVFRIEQIESLLHRSETLMRLLVENYNDDINPHFQSFLSQLVRESINSLHIRPLLSNNLHLLSRKIVERSGESGEHYITRNKNEYTQMALSAMGGGALTTFTALIKFLITKLQPALFVEGMLSWINYAGSFLLMQSLHFTLATKQPSMTAPTLASKLKNIKNRDQIHDFIEEIRNIVRSQFIAAVGNVGMVIPCALIFNLIFYFSIGAPVLSKETSLKVIYSLNPLTSLTLFYGALTGAILFASSLIAGWAENWFTYRKLGDAIGQSPLLFHWFGKNKTKKFSQWLSRNVSGITGNLALGFLLAFTTVAGEFFGLALDVRHVTLSAGSLAFAVSSLGFDSIPWAATLGAGIGVIFIGLLNFGVSFILALLVAIRARNVKKTWLNEILRVTKNELKSKPLSFFIPPRN